MTALAFVRTGAAPLYYASADGGNPLLTVAFLPAAPSQQASYTSEQAWAAAGCYLFLSAPPTDPTGFVSTVQAYLQSVVGTRFLWVNPNSAGALQATPWVLQGGTGLLPVTFAFNSVSLVILGGVLVTPAPGQPGFDIALNGDQAAYLQTQSGGQLGAPINGLYLPLWGDQAGSLQFPTQLGAADLDANGLDHALRYWTDNAVIPGLLATQRFPLFALSGSERIAVAATMDPLAPLVGNRTHFALGSGAIPSCFCTPDGAAIALTPAATGTLTGPRLVFANNPGQLNSADPPNFYLVPEGGFTLNTPSALQADGAPSRLLLGMSGSEYVRFVPGQDVLAFTPNQPAFNVAAPAHGGRPPRAAARPRAVAANEPPDISPYLSDQQGQVTTAWARIIPRSQACAYCAQPPTAPQYYVPQPSQAETEQAEAQSAAPKVPLLAFLEMPMQFKLTTNADQAAAGEAPGTWPLPLVPYLGLNLSDYITPDWCTSLEAQAIAPARRLRVQPSLSLPTADPSTSRRLPAPNAGAGPRASITPTGLLSTLDGSGAVTGYQLAASRTSGGKVYDPTLKQPSASLQYALQQEHLFLIASQSSDGASPLFNFDGQVTIADWLFDMGLPPQRPVKVGAPAPVLLFKFYPGALTDLVDDLGVWAGAEQFNADPAEIQSLVRTIIADAVKTVAEDPDSLLADFVSVVQDANWQGVLALNCGLVPTALPLAIRAILVGIDMDRLYAHHVGVTLSDTEDSLDLSLAKSSLFGLVDYEGTRANIATDGGDFKFTVNYLRALFRNSDLNKFNCEIALTINQLFDLPVKAEEVTTNTLTIAGTYQQPVGANQAGTYSFVNDTDDWVFAFAADSQPNGVVLTTIEFSKLQFAPLSVDAVSVSSLFSFWGNLATDAGTDGLDVFSFDKLPFANLNLGMQGPAGGGGTPTWRFAPQEMRFDQSRSVVRADSLAQQLPLKLTGLIYTPNNGIGLGALGYSPLHMPPETTQPTTQSCTYALLFTLDLGTPGALVAAAVGFQATILAGWQRTGNTILGFRLPLLTGATQLTIQGVLQLYLGKYSLDYVAVPAKKHGDDPTQLLGIRFDSFNLEILGSIYPASVTTDPRFQFNFMLFAPPPGNAIAWYAALKLDLPA